MAAETTRPVAVYTDVDDTDITPGIALLEDAGFAVRVLGTRDPEAIIAGAREATVLLPGYSEITREMIAALPQLRLICLMSMGTDTVDVEAASEHGVWVTNVPGAATGEVAAHALTMTLASLRRLPFYQSTANPGEWNSRSPLAPRRVSTLTLGLVGLGRIGREFARVASPLFGRVIGSDPFLPRTPETEASLAEAGVERVDLDEVRSRADVLSLHLPLTEDTEAMVDADFLAAMSAGSMLVNVSRGGLVDHVALAAALDAGHLAGAALDVLDEEPPPHDHPMLGRDDVVLTPHIAYYSDRTLIDYVRVQAENAVALAATGAPSSPVNEPRGV